MVSSEAITLSARDGLAFQEGPKCVAECVGVRNEI